MPMDRRSFVLHSGFVIAVSPALMRLPAPAFGGTPTAVPSSLTLNKVEFSILGWDSLVAGSAPIGEHFAFRINQGWRSAWR